MRVREADTLWEAGHQVRVISRRVDPQLAQADRELAGTRGWRLEHVDLQRDGPRRSAWLRAAVVSRIFKTLFRCGAKNIGIVSRAALRGFDELLLLALSEPADWFIAHTQLALPLASAAARHWNANLACDCEDLLADLGFENPMLIQFIEREYLPRCRYVSVPSKAMGQRLVASYGIKTPLVLYNPTFPTSTSDPCSSDLPVTNNQNLSALQPRNKCFSSYFG